MLRTRPQGWCRTTLTSRAPAWRDDGPHRSEVGQGTSEADWSCPGLIATALRLICASPPEGGSGRENPAVGSRTPGRTCSGREADAYVQGLRAQRRSRSSNSEFSTSGFRAGTASATGRCRRLGAEVPRGEGSARWPRNAVVSAVPRNLISHPSPRGRPWAAGSSNGISGPKRFDAPVRGLPTGVSVAVRHPMVIGRDRAGGRRGRGRSHAIGARSAGRRGRARGGGTAPRSDRPRARPRSCSVRSAGRWPGVGRGSMMRSRPRGVASD